ncbi:MAG: phosphate signaling complex protein PhoU [Planctomyces sp.]
MTTWILDRANRLRQHTQGHDFPRLASDAVDPVIAGFAGTRITMSNGQGDAAAAGGLGASGAGPGSGSGSGLAADGASGGTPTLPRNVLGTHHGMLEEQILAVKRRLVMEAGSAIGMLESAIEALVKLDEPAAREVIRRDDEIDKEEVRIEEECLRLLALFNPLARDFRTVAALMRVNADLERVADHATSLCKQTIKLRKFKDAGTHIALPTSLVELGQRVPIQCQTLMRALVNEKADDARAVIMKDAAIDTLDKRLFDECVDAMTETREGRSAGMLYYRCGRELERVGDLMTNIAEDVLYLATGSIVRHEEKKRLKGQAG